MTAKTINPEPAGSPCIRNCCLDDQDVCMGCFRSLTEIVAWGMADDAERRRILEQAQMRRNRTGAHPAPR